MFENHLYTSQQRDMDNAEHRGCQGDKNSPKSFPFGLARLMNVNRSAPKPIVILVTLGLFVSRSVMLYGGEPPATVMPQGAHVSMFSVTFAETVKAGVLMGVMTHCVVCPAEMSKLDRNVVLISERRDMRNNDKKEEKFTHQLP